MDYKDLDNLLGLSNLNDFTNQLTVNGCQSVVVLQQTGTRFNLDEDPWKYWGLNFDWKNPFGITDKLNTLVKNIQDIWRKVCDTFTNVWNLVGGKAAWWWHHLFDTLNGLMYDVSYEFKKFIWNPATYIWNAIKGGIKTLIDGIKMVGIDIWDFVLKVRNAISDVVSSFVSAAQNVIVNWITNKVNVIYNWLISVRDWIVDHLKTFLLTLKFLPGEMAITVTKLSSEALSQISASTSAILKTIDFGLGGLATSFYNALTGLIDKAWDWFLSLVSKLSLYLKDEFFEPLMDTMKNVWGWLVRWFRSLWDKVKDTLYKLAPTAPEKGEELIESAMGLLGLGISGFGALTGVSMLVSWLSKHHLGHLSALLYDASSYKYISAAVMGGLVFAAYTQPLKYFYNAKFRPYLPAWKDACLMYDRSIITDDEFKFFMKYNGIPDKWFDYYYKVYDKPVSPRQLAPASAWETMDLSDFIYEITFYGLWPERAESTARFLWWGGKEPWTTRLLTAMMYGLRRGFFGAEKIVKQFRDLLEEPRTIEIVDKATGRRVTKSSHGFPSNLELITLIGEWERTRLKADAMVDAIKVQYKEDLITEEEARKEMAKYIVIPEVIDSELAPIKYRKAKQPEPEKGKPLRDELKTIIRMCYKEGLITHKYLEEQLDNANVLVDEKTLILLRAEWEAFYDDMMDWRKIYEKSLADGLITEAEFRRDLIDMGFRASKVELMIKYDRAKKKGRIE